MLDLNLINGRYFQVKINEIKLELEPCKLKTMRRFANLSKNGGDDDLIDVVKEVLNKNKTKYIVDDELVGELDIDQMNELLLAYFEWIAKEKATNPN